MKVGDTIKVSGKEFKVSGLIAYVNYSTLHEKKTDMMFDAIKFDVAMVTKEGFERLNKSIHYTYAWKYEDEPADKLKKNEIAVVKIAFSDKIVCDKFKNHKTLGEFILIDRVTDMTSACGVVEEVHTEESGLYEIGRAHV